MLLHPVKLVATKEITLTHTLIVGNAPITISATKEHKTQQFKMFFFSKYVVSTACIMLGVCQCMSYVHNSY